MARVLLVEDEERIAAPLGRTLSREGYEVVHVTEGGEALETVCRGGVDLVLLDLGLPDMDGLDVCRTLRERGYLGGIMILTARDGELDRVVGLDGGADDYLAKPFPLAELLARTRALLRRSQATVAVETPAADPANTGLRVDAGARRAWSGEDELALTAKEFDLLALLEAHAGEVLTREQVIGQVWDENWFGSTKMLDTTLGRLRQKLDEASAPVQVVTVRGVGFRLERDAPGA